MEQGKINVSGDIVPAPACDAPLGRFATIDPSVKVADKNRRGRGATVNPSGRFEPYSRHSFDDGWGNLDVLEPFKTDVQIEQARTIISRNTSPDLPFDRSINPYRGCEHGCIYCFARPTHANMGLSPGLDFEAKLFAKPDAAKLLKRELSKPSYKPKAIAIGTNTDPYQPIERKMRIMRGVLEVLAEAKHPVTIVTKSALVLRDLDILTPMAKDGLVKVTLSITSLDRKMARSMEPRAATPTRRLEALRSLKEAGVPTSVLVAPIIPGLTDHEIEHILEACAHVGILNAKYIILRLPREVSSIFKDWLLRYYPDRYRHVMGLIQSVHGGKDYDADFGKRVTGTGPYAWQIRRRFELACRRLSLSGRGSPLRLDLFQPPKGDQTQLSLF